MSKEENNKKNDTKKVQNNKEINKKDLKNGKEINKKKINNNEVNKEKVENVNKGVEKEKGNAVNSDRKDLIVKKEKPYKERKGKWLRQTSLSVLLILIIIAACIGINLFVEEQNLPEIDVTKDKLYSLSEKSKEYAKSIDKDVEIMLINMGESEEDFANKYSSINDKIKVEVIENFSARTDLQDEYGLTSDSLAIIVKSGEKDKLLSYYDLYTSDYYTGKTKSTIEEALTNAIIDVTVDEKPIIYNLVGHNKYSSDALYLFTSDLTEEAYEIKELDLLTAGSVPEDCSVLMITTIAEDIKETEKDAILDYINKGGKIILFSDPNSTGIEMPNFQKVLDEYGVKISEGIMLEQDSDKMLMGTPNAILTTVSPYTSVTKQTNMNLQGCFITSGKIDIDSEKLEDLGVEAETLATTSANSYYRTDYSIEVNKGLTDDDTAEGYATVGALLKKKIDDNTTSELIVYANNTFITNILIYLTPQSSSYALDFYNNEDLAMNSIAYLTERENMITIRKDTQVTTYSVTEQQNTIILSIIFAIPALIVVIGIIVWQYRRRKK